MYFPYLRGRQFELIALRELVEKGVLSSRITPIIEPVKLSSTLVKTIEAYGENSSLLSLPILRWGALVVMPEKKKSEVKGKLVCMFKRK